MLIIPSASVQKFKHLRTVPLKVFPVLDLDPHFCPWVSVFWQKHVLFSISSCKFYCFGKCLPIHRSFSNHRIHPLPDRSFPLNWSCLIWNNLPSWEVTGESVG